MCWGVGDGCLSEVCVGQRGGDDLLGEDGCVGVDGGDRGLDGQSVSVDCRGDEGAVDCCESSEEDGNLREERMS